MQRRISLVANMNFNTNRASQISMYSGLKVNSGECNVMGFYLMVS